MSLQRTPPALLNQTQSDPNLPHSVLHTELENVNIQNRSSKRPCPAFSPGSDMQDLKDDIKEMLNTWKAEQDANLSHILSEQCSLISKLTAELAELKVQNLSIQKSNFEIEKSMTYMNQQYEVMHNEIITLQKERKEYLNTINELEKGITDVKQSSRSSSIEIRNVPRAAQENSSNLTEIVTNLSVTLQTPLKGIRDIYRIPGKPETVKPIVVELNSVQDKEQLLLAAKNYNKSRPIQERLNTSLIGCQGNPQPIYIAEYLPTSTKKLFYLAREFAKLNKFDFCWTANGKIFLRKEPGAKHILVASEEILKDLQRQQ